MDSLVIEELTDQDSLQSEYDRLHRELLEGWKADEETKKMFAYQDQSLIDKLDELLSKTNIRETRVGNVTSNLYQQLENMNKYLIKMIGKSDQQIQNSDTQVKAK